MLFFKREFFPILTDLLNILKSVKTTAGIFRLFFTLSGKNELNPLIPPNNNSPVLNLQFAPIVNSLL